jgi:hypothetical protein
MARFVDEEKIAGVIEIFSDKFVCFEFELNIVVAFDFGRNIADPKVHSHLPELIVNCRAFGEDALLVGSISCPSQPSRVEVDCALAAVSATHTVGAIIALIKTLIVIRGPGLA